MNVNGTEVREALLNKSGFCLSLRQTEGLLTSLVRLMDVDIAVPDYSCLITPLSLKAAGKK